VKPVDIVRTAFGNAFRAKLRTSLTVLAIIIGAFTLSLTNGIGTGINNYISDTVAGIGVDDVMTVTKTSERAGFDTGPAEYDPNQLAAGEGGPHGGPGPVVGLTSDDIDTIAGVEGVIRVAPVKNVSLDYVQHGNGKKYQLSLSQFAPGMRAELAAGSQIDLEAHEAQIVLPEPYLEPLGFTTADAAVGREVTLAVTNVTGAQTTTTATIVGVAAPGIVSVAGAIPNDVLLNTLFDLQSVGAAPGTADLFASASVWFDANAGDAATTALQKRLSDAGFTATTLADQLGTMTSVIDVIVMVLSGFAVIALLAASIGIVNTLYMAVQERTREVGLMKAMGLSSARVFALFSVEAVVIGLLGSALGVAAAVVVGKAASAALANSVLSAMPGLSIVAFNPLTVALVVLGVMALAFLAGTMPALRAAKQDPIASLRYE